MPTKKITVNAVKALKKGETIWDTGLKGFGCRCQASGKFFVLKYSINKRQRYFTIGRWDGSLTPDQARDQAEILRGQIRQGIDPMAEKERDQAIPLVKDAFKKYLEDVAAKRSPRTHAEYSRLFEKLAKKSLGKHQVNAVSRADIARIHNQLKDTPYQANRLLAVLSTFFSWCIKHGHRTDGTNPCRHIDKFKEKPRERFLSEDELFKLGQALTRYGEVRHRYAATAIRLLILTGARVNEILTLKWKDVELDRKLIRLQESKTGQKTIYLSAPALQLLSKLPRIEGNPYVICGKKKNTHLVNIKDPWIEIRKDAGLEDVRLHDLRHNFASTAVMSGHHLKVIGSLLGHKDTQTTERYAHLANDPLQAANEAVSKRIMQTMESQAKEKNIVKLRG